MPSRLRFEKQTSAGRRTENISVIATRAVHLLHEQYKAVSRGSLGGK